MAIVVYFANVSDVFPLVSCAVFCMIYVLLCCFLLLKVELFHVVVGPGAAAMSAPGAEFLQVPIEATRKYWHDSTILSRLQK